MAAPLCIFTPDPLQTSPQAIVLLLQMVRHGFTIQPSVWPAFLASFPYPDASKETGPQGLICLVVGHSDRIRQTE